MVWRIVLDVIWRKRRAIPFGIFQFYLFSSSFPRIFPAIDPMGFVLVGAGFMAVPSGPWNQIRELYQLPVSRRTWWLAQWWTAAAAATTIPVIGGALGEWVVRSQPPGAEQIVLSVVFAFLYCGCATAFAATFGRQFDAPASWSSVLVVGPAVVILVPVPLFLGGLVPHKFADLNAAVVVVMLLMAAWSAHGYRVEPTIAPRPGRGVPLLGSKPVSHVEAKPRFADRFTGLQFAFWSEGRTQLLTFALAIVLLTAGWIVSSLFRQVPTLPEFLRLADALPFSTARASATEIVTWTFLFFFANMREPWIFNDARRLRALPLSANQVALLTLALGVLSTISLWVVLGVLHLVVLGSVPVSPRSDLFMAFAGLTTLADALRIVVPGRGSLKAMLPLAPVALIVLSAEYFTEGWQPNLVQPSLFVGGLVLLIVSVLIARFAFARTSHIYRQPTPVVRLG